MKEFMNKFFGITKRMYYLIAVCLAIGYLVNFTFQMSKWRFNPWYYQTELTKLIQGDKHKDMTQLSNRELQDIVDAPTILVQVNSDIDNILLCLFGFIITLPVAIGLHRLAHWIVWGKIR